MLASEREIETEVRELKKAIKILHPDVPSEILERATALAAAKMLLYELARCPQEDDYLFSILPDCIGAVYRELEMTADAREKMEPGAFASKENLKRKEMIADVV